MAIEAHDRRAMALKQLETALQLYFDGADYYSVITLSGAADEIFGQLLAARGVETRLESIKKSVAAIYAQVKGTPLDHNKVAERANLARNALKHCGEGQPLVVEFDTIEEAKDMLERAISNYWTLESNLSPACCASNVNSLRPNLSLNPDASPAALSRRPLGAG